MAKASLILLALLTISGLNLHADVFTTLNYQSPYWFGPVNDQALAINDNGQVIGTTCCFAASGGTPFGLFYYDGVSQFTTCYSAGLCVDGPFENLLPTSIPCSTFCTGTPAGFNDSQTVVGNYSDPSDFTVNGFIQSPPVDSGTASNFIYPGLTPGLYYSSIAGINDSGTIIGSFTDFGTGASGGYVYQNGVFSQLSYLPISINNNGQILGALGNGDYVIDTNGNLKDIGKLPFAPTGFNDRLQMVGGNDFYTGGKVIPIFAPGGIPVSINGINDSDTLVGSYSSGPNTFGFTDTVTPEPKYVALMGVMLLVLLACRKVRVAAGAGSDRS